MAKQIAESQIDYEKFKVFSETPIKLVNIVINGVVIEQAFPCTYEMYAMHMGLPIPSNCVNLIGYVRIKTNEFASKNDSIRLIDLPNSNCTSRFTFFIHLGWSNWRDMFARYFDVGKLKVGLEEILKNVGTSDIDSVQYDYAKQWGIEKYSTKILTVFTVKELVAGTPTTKSDVYFSSLNKNIDHLGKLLETIQGCLDRWYVMV
jgi:hypothetical protein